MNPVPSSSLGSFTTSTGVVLGTPTSGPSPLGKYYNPLDTPHTPHDEGPLGSSGGGAALSAVPSTASASIAQGKRRGLAAAYTEAAPRAPVVFSVGAVANRRTVANEALVPIACLWSPVPQTSQGAAASSSSPMFAASASSSSAAAAAAAASASSSSSSPSLGAEGADTEVPTLRRPGVRCSRCRAFPSPFGEVVFHTGEWRCALCNKKNDPADVFRGGSQAVCPEVVLRTVEYVDPAAQPSLGPAAVPGTQHVCLVVDVNLTAEGLDALRLSLEEIVDRLDPETRVSVVTFGSVVCVYDVTAACGPMAPADVFPGSASPSGTAHLRHVASRHASLLAPLHRAGDGVRNVFRSWMPTLEAEVVFHDPRRSLGVALEVALSLFEAARDTELVAARAAGSRLAASSFVGKLMVCLTGTPNHGPGGVRREADDDQVDFYFAKATEYYAYLSRRALACETMVDVFCGGNSSFAVPLLQNVALGNGGVVLMHTDFGPAFAQNAIVALNRCVGYAGAIDIVTSSPLEVSRIIGPAVAFSSIGGGSAAGSDTAAAAAGAASPAAPQQQTPAASAPSAHYPTSLNRDSPNLCRMGGVQPQHSFSVYFELTDDVALEHLYVQFVAEYTNWDNQRVVRVTTRRLPTTGNPLTFVRSFNVDAVSVLIAKRAVLTARKLSGSGSGHSSSASNQPVLEDIDALARELAVKYGTPSKAKKASGDRTYDLPKELAPLALSLFHLRRGPMLGEILQHADDIDVLRCLFLHGGFDVSLRIVRPRLLLALEGGSFAEVPLENLALQSHHILYLDHETDIFIWSGLHTVPQPHGPAQNPQHLASCDAMRSACKALAASAASTRFPVPRVHSFTEGSSMARWLTCRVIPSHRDPAEMQNQSFPLLAHIPDDQRRKLLQKFTGNDEISFREWWRHLFV